MKKFVELSTSQMLRQTRASFHYCITVTFQRNIVPSGNRRPTFHSSFSDSMWEKSKRLPKLQNETKGGDAKHFAVTDAGELWPYNTPHPARIFFQIRREGKSPRPGGILRYNLRGPKGQTSDWPQIDHTSARVHLYKCLKDIHALNCGPPHPVWLLVFISESTNQDPPLGANATQAKIFFCVTPSAGVPPHLRRLKQMLSKRGMHFAFAIISRIQNASLGLNKTFAEENANKGWLLHSTSTFPGKRRLLCQSKLWIQQQRDTKFQTSTSSSVLPTIKTQLLTQIHTKHSDLHCFVWPNFLLLQGHVIVASEQRRKGILFVHSAQGALHLSLPGEGTPPWGNRFPLNASPTACPKVTSYPVVLPVRVVRNVALFSNSLHQRKGRTPVSRDQVMSGLVWGVGTWGKGGALPRHNNDNDNDAYMTP